MNILTTILAGGALALMAGAALAQDPPEAEGGMAMEGMDHSAEAMAAMSPAMQGYMGAMETMMTGTPMETLGDADADFLAMMIPHHQSAVDMAKVLLEEGDNPEVRALAEQVIASQEAEIAEMTEMLAAMTP